MTGPNHPPIVYVQIDLDHVCPRCSYSWSVKDDDGYQLLLRIVEAHDREDSYQTVELIQEAADLLGVGHPIDCDCGHRHVVEDEDGGDAGCRVCDCRWWHRKPEHGPYGNEGYCYCGAYRCPESAA